MMPISFKQQTHVIPGGENHVDIPVYREGHRTISCWRLNKEEMDQIVKNGIIWLHVVGDTFPHMKMSGHDPFKKLEPIVVDERMVNDLFQILIEDDELVFIRIKENECNFRVVTDDYIWYHLFFRLRGDTDKKIQAGIYSFKEPVEVVGLGVDCPEYWWVLPQLGLTKDTTLIVKRSKPAHEQDNS